MWAQPGGSSQGAAPLHIRAAKAYQPGSTTHDLLPPRLEPLSSPSILGASLHTSCRLGEGCDMICPLAGGLWRRLGPDQEGGQADGLCELQPRLHRSAKGPELVRLVHCIVLSHAWMRWSCTILAAALIAREKIMLMAPLRRLVSRFRGCHTSPISSSAGTNARSRSPHIWLPHCADFWRIFGS